MVNKRSKTGGIFQPQKFFGPNSTTMSSLNFWNVDMLGTSLPKNVYNGFIRPIPLTDETPIRSLAFGFQDLLWIIKPALHQVEVGKPPGVPFRPVITWDDDFDVTDLAYDFVNQRMYLLDALGKRIWVIDDSRGLPNSRLSLSSLSYWSLDALQLTTESRIAVWCETQDGVPIAVVSGSDRSRLLLQVLHPRGSQRLLELKWKDLRAASSATLSSITIDDHKGVALLARDETHEVFECDLISGETSLLCGTGTPGAGGDGLSPSEMELHEPTDLVVFHYSDYLDTKMLTTSSARRLAQATASGNERCILIADHLNNKVRKVVEFENVRCGLTLLGVGSDQARAAVSQPVRRNRRSQREAQRLSSDPNTVVVPQEGNLLTVSIPVPSRLAMSLSGELAVLYRNGQSILLLTPASRLYIYHTTEKKDT